MKEIIEICALVTIIVVGAVLAGVIYLVATWDTVIDHCD
jgi:hypothetical protein